ncbi:hypothetical protein MASR1M66_01880 [Aminivibrio sp.]
MGLTLYAGYSDGRSGYGFGYTPVRELLKEKETVLLSVLPLHGGNVSAAFLKRKKEFSPFSREKLLTLTEAARKDP